MSERIRVRAWSELTEPKQVYPNGISGALAEHLGSQPDMEVRTASIEDPDQGVSEADLERTDVLLWFGHVKHGQVTQESVDRVVRPMLPYVLFLCLGLLFVILFPWLTLVLPRLFGL